MITSFSNKNTFNTQFSNGNSSGTTYFQNDYTDVSNQYDILHKVVEISPEQAERLLENNYSNNRRLNARSVNRYAKAMTNGEWKIGEPLMFDHKGILINGQHRLRAVVKSGKSIRFNILENINPETMQSLDRGKNRNLSQIGQIMGYEWLTNRHISTFTAMLLILPNNRNIGATMTDKERVNAIINCREGIEFGLTKKGTGLSSVVLSGVVSRAYYSDMSSRHLLNDFLLLVHGCNYFDNPSLFSQTNMSPYMPLQVRDFFLGRKWEKRADEDDATIREYQYQYIQSALKHFLTQSKAKYVRGRKDNVFPVPWIDNLTFQNPELM